MWYNKTKLLVCLLIWSWCLLAQAQPLPGSPEGIIPCSNPQVCGCNDATSCLDCEGVPNGTASKLPCAGSGCGSPELSCGSCFSCPTPTQTPEQCIYYQMNFSHVASHRDSSATSVDQTKAQTLDCFSDIMRSIVKAHDPSKVTYADGITARLWKLLVEKIGKDRQKDYEENKQYLNCTGKYESPRADTHNGHGMIGGGMVPGDKGRKTPGCSVGRFVMNNKCELQNYDSIKYKLKTCNVALLNLKAEVATPVSLVWNEAYKTQASTLVNFKLNPYSDNNTWLWRGSESLPLLVYDPEHTGVINSATQLFGSWTFGGIGLASLIEGNTRGTPWRDGYEALFKMDQDLDGKVSGAELKDLGLWFDKNQDGISQKGEVKLLSEVSVTALYYKSDKKEVGALVATKGYEREVDGRTITASSMDWYEKGLKDGFEVMLEKFKSSSTSMSPNVDNTSDYSKNVFPEIYGSWGWSLEAPAKGSGFFAFDSSEDGVIGATISQVGIAGVSGASSQVLFAHFEATTSKNNEGLVEVKFITDGGDGAILTNTASLSKDGSSLLGKTVVTGSNLSESGSYEYSWKAERLK